MNQPLIIGTRGSELALWQAQYVQNLLATHQISTSLKIILTSGDKNQQWQNSFDKLEGKNFFTKEIEDALLKKEIDLAVHSFKDVEASFFDNSESTLVIAGLSIRHNPQDVLILHKNCVDNLPYIPIKYHARIGTSSARRYAQLQSLRPDVQILPLRGNVPTRIQKLQIHQYDGIILARAGIERLQLPLDDFEVYPLPLHLFVPAAGQGIIAYQVRKEDITLIHLLQKISNPISEECSKIERQLLKQIGGGCSQPVGVLCQKDHSHYKVYISLNTQKNLVSIPSILNDTNPHTLLLKAKDNITHIQQLLHKPVSKKILITHTLEPYAYLKKLTMRLKWDITDIPLIYTEKIDILELPECEWIFFNSKNAVKYFITQNIFHSSYVKNKKIAALSSSTAYYLQKQGLPVHFIGQGTDTNQIARDFLKYAIHQKILFPCSNISIRSIEKFIDTQTHIIHLPVYNTKEKPIALHTSFDYYIFTSPSNVRAFFKLNQISSDATVIAMGTSTAKELEHHNVPSSQIVLPIAFDDVAIAAAMMSRV